jgi:transcriptional regulator with XRE-family HTH domain
MLNPNGDETKSAADAAPPPPSAPPTPRGLTIAPAWRAGRKLEEARTQLGLSYEQVAQRIKVRREYLEALEAMNAKLLPGKAYALAYLRSYAALLGLDAQAIVEQFREEVAMSREDAQPQIRSPESRPRQRRPWIWVLAIIVTGIGWFVGYRVLQNYEAAQRAEQQARTAPAPRPAVESAPVGRRRLVVLRASTAAWLEVRGPDGTVFYSRTLAAGESYAPDASAGWTIHARDGGAFEVFIDGEPAGLLGLANVPVLGRRVDEIEPLPVAPPPPRPVRSATPGAPAAARPPKPQPAITPPQAPAPAPEPADAMSSPTPEAQPEG